MMITIEKSFGVIQKVLVLGFEKAGFSDVSLFLVIHMARALIISSLPRHEETDIDSYRVVRVVC